jgi:hypothetical protein
MTLKYSTGLVNSILGTSGLKGAFASGFVIDVYSSATTRPTTANDAVVSPVLLGTITKGGALPASGANVINFGTPSVGAIDKNTDTWSFVGLAVTGGASTTAAWFRLREATDDNTLDSTATKKRIDGTVGTLGDISLSSSTIVAGNTYTLNQFKLSWPAANI